MTDISIVIPTHNRKEMLAMAVASALAIQRYNVEVIIVDDGSTDGTSSLMWEDKRIKLLIQKQAGGNVARNRGMSAATGKYIKFLDDDDYLIPESVEAQILFLEETGYDVCYGSWWMLIEKREKSEKRLEQKNQINNPVTSLLNLWSCAPFAYLIRRHSIEGVQWDESLSGFQDFDFMLKVAERVKVFYFIDLIIGYYRVHEQGNVMRKSPLKRALNLVKLLDNASGRFQMTIDGEEVSTDLKKALAQGYYAPISALYQWDRPTFHVVRNKIRALDKNFKPSSFYPKRDQTLVPLLGITFYHTILQVRRRFLNLFTGYLNEIDAKVQGEN